MRRRRAARGGAPSTLACCATPPRRRALAAGHGGSPSSDSVEAGLDFIRRPSARRWYRAHNHSIVSAYLAHRDLAEQEGRVERFFINLALVRVLYAHALVAAPRLALGPFAPSRLRSATRGSG